MSSLPARYESFLISNSSTIATIESSLRSLTWFLPGRFKDAEIVSEALTSTLNLLSLYHDTLLARRLQLVKSSLPKSAINSYSELIPPSAHSRYTRAWSEKDAVYKWSARGLEVLRFMQLVLEMLLKRFTGRNARWRGIFLLELTKALLRLLLLQRTKRPILSPSIPERDVDPASLPALIDLAPSSPPLKPNNTSIDESTESTTTTQTSSTVPTHLSNNHVPFNSSGKPHPLLSSLQSVPLTRTIIEDYLLPKALTPSLVKSPTTLLPQIQGVGQWLSEILYILRPLIYVSMLRPTTQNLVKGTTSINYNTQSSLHSLRTPLAVSLLLSLLSRHLRPKPPVSPSSATSLERLEYARRDKELFWNVFRGEIWTEWTRPKLEGLRTRMEGRPLGGLLSGVVQDWMWLVDEYYYYTAT